VNEKVLEAAWKEFEAKCIPPHAGKHQRTAVKDAFYAGASQMWCFFGLMRRLPDEAAVDAFARAVWEEMVDFCKDRQAEEDSFKRN
jgi:hypothetical protein